jgi:starch phosphorylase
MRPIVTFTVEHDLPEQLARLNELCRNLYWTWNPTIREFLRSIDPERWHLTNHNPLKVLQDTPPERLRQLAGDPEFVGRYHEALRTLEGYLSARRWYGTRRSDRSERIAYFSAEFGLHESVPLYSGGLGVLSGDHTKSASDLQLPFVCVGLMYQMGYFCQRLTHDGVQLETYDFNDPSTLPLTEMTDASRRPLRIGVEFPRGTVHARIWRLDVGTVPRYLLDTNIKENTITEYRDIADYLYGGDREVRIMQEIMLGIGGIRALRALGIEPTVTHSNEGHSAFLMLERTRLLMEEMGMTFAEAAELAAAGSVFTTHTPVPAGNDVFPVEMMEKYFSRYWPLLGLSREEFYSLGRVNPSDVTEGFSMTVLALKMTSRHNGVSQLHARVSHDMWKGIWSGIPASETPITGITNGVHTQTWVADAMSGVFDQHLGDDWRTRITDTGMWSRTAEIPSGILWSVKNQLRSDLINYVRWRLEEQHAETYTSSTTGRNAGGILNPEVLTIGFARRFATYKRATLLLRDRERALRLFNDAERPIQLVIAGKAHPKDIPGKEFIKAVMEFLHETGLEEKIVFIEDYDLAVARRMVQGCDIWLNTPRRPQEASGTSGMKAAINGTLNTSILDGWFPEAYDGTNGFAIGSGEEFTDPNMQDEIESRQLYRLLEEDIIPMFYSRNKKGVPEKWVAMQKRALVTMAAQFSSDRMVEEYAERFYFPCSDRFQRLRADGGRAVRDLIGWKRRIYQAWSGVRFVEVTTDAAEGMKVGEGLPVTARMSLGILSPDEVRVEVYYGRIDADGLISDGESFPLQRTDASNGLAVFAGNVPLHRVGHAGMTVRAMPSHPELGDKFAMNLVTWAPLEVMAE